MNLLYKLAGVLFLVISLIVGWFWQSLNTFSHTPIKLEQPSVEFTIPLGSSLSQIAYQLEKQLIINDASKFRWMIKLDGNDKAVQAGEYELTQGMTPQDLLALFVSGKVKQYSFTIVEGWSFKQLMIALSSSEQLKHTLQGQHSEAIMAELGFDGEHPEGRFLPDTYHFPSGTTDKAFLLRAHKAMEIALEEEWQNKSGELPYKTAYEALTMASIVEKETAVPSERKAIAGVFVQRLFKRMRLQTDPTVIYGMGDSYKGNLRKKDLKKDTPYNTYRRKGLPPTPIAMPGRAAINAALHPENTKALYFVAKGDGSHYFSETVEEHNKAVRKYQIRQRSADYRSTPEPVDNNKE